MQLSGIPYKIPITWAQSAGAGYITNPIPQSSQIGVTAGKASWPDGFVPASFVPTGSGGTPPWGADFNGALSILSQWARWQQAGGSVQYDLTFSTATGGYPQGATLLSSATPGLFWLSTIDSNTTNPDGGSPTGWIGFGPAVNLLHFGTDTGSANTMTVTSITPSVSVTAGMLIEVTKAASANTGAMTGTIGNISGANILWADGTALRGGDWPASTTGLLYYNGTAFLLLTSFIRSSAFQFSSSLNFYVNGSIGNDSNDGLSNASGHAFATITGAIAAITSRYQSLNTANVYVANGTYNGFTVSASGVANWVFTGNTSTPSSCVLSASSGSINTGRGIVATGASNVSATGFSFSTTLENAASSGAYLSLMGSCAFSAPSTSPYPCVSANSGGRTNVYGASNTYTGSMYAFAEANWGATLFLGYTDPATTNSLALTATGTTTFSGGFVACTSCGAINVYPTVCTFSGSPTGPRYNMSLNGTVNTQGSGTGYLPGNAAGSLSTGGQYA